MSYTLEHVRLLIVHDSQDDAEQLMNSLRNAGKVTRAEIALSEDDFIRAVKSGSWELIVCRPEVAGCSYQKILAHLNRLGKALPMIVLVDALTPAVMAEALSAGARMVAPMSERDLLMLVIDRQIEYLSLRKELQYSQLALHDAEKRLSVLMDQSRDAIAYVVDGMHIHANDVYLERFGYASSDDLAGMPIMDMVSAADHEKLKKLLRSRAQNENQTNELECRGIGPGGKEFDAVFTFSASTYDGEACTQIVIRAAEVDESAIQERLQEMSQIDQVTGLYNRGWFLDQVDASLANAVRTGHMYAVSLIRIDDFETHQSAVGLDGADELLRQLATLISQSADADSSLSRIDGEDFAVLSPVNDREVAGDWAEKVRAGIEKMMPAVASRTLKVTASIGVAFVTDDTRSAQATVNKALECCVRARDESKGKGNTVYVHSPMDDVEAGSSEAVALVLRDALEKGALALQYQAIMNLEDDSSHFFEVFVHLPQADGSILQPAQFMPVAGELGMAGKIDRWVVLNAIKAAAAQKHSVKVLINLSGFSLQDNGFSDWVGKAIKASKIPGKQVVFQFSEVDVNNHLKQAADFAGKVQPMGCAVSVSRFAGAQEPLKLFDHVPVNMVKFDGSYTQDLANKESKEKFAKLIGEVSGKGKQVMVGFVEAASQMQTLWTMGGVNFLQGYYMQPPVGHIQVDEGE
ncbi:EAL domain-containing protein [Alcanivorax sp. 1008]|uniref:EAL domain-containing response regulator n=1 Tax=Alcanivorax sp. 1008 TaxID=2816853 RepID=UPI001DEE03A9|nr:EAL domain-containing protein [Alcanivorax sp. 1008]MCC1496947.1 EAL domain-containing protein [Alcanivorax sp. 1008]